MAAPAAASSSRRSASAPAVATTGATADAGQRRPEAWNIGALTAPVDGAATDAPEVGPRRSGAIAELQPPIVEAIKTVYDPEIPVDIYELGLIYDIIVDAERRVLVKMTLTSPACPSAQQIAERSRATRSRPSPASPTRGSRSSGSPPGRRTGCRKRRSSRWDSFGLSLVLVLGFSPGSQLKPSPTCPNSPTSTRRSSSITTGGRGTSARSTARTAKPRATTRSAAIGSRCP